MESASCRSAKKFLRARLATHISLKDGRPMHHIRWRSRGDIAGLEETISQLRTDNVRLRRELQTKQNQNGGLKTVLRQRLTRIDDLTATIDQLREQNRQLDAEADPN